MRMGCIALAATLFLAPAALAQGTADETVHLTSREIGNYLRTYTQKPDKPTGVSTGRYTGSDTCQYANDGECDDPGLGTGACRQGTDYSDCWRLAEGVEDNSCRWANDGECDEPGFGTGACTQATDLADCGSVINLRFRNDSCETAFNGVCNEPEIGDGTCAARSDRADCFGRERPMGINDHYFGFDDRVFMDTSTFPWSVVGEVSFDSGGGCTATLIAENVIVTAAHCISDNTTIDARGVFRTGFDRRGGPEEARITGYLIDPEWNEQRFTATDEIDGTDWALLRLRRPLGRELGFVGVRALVESEGRRAAQNFPLYQAGYSWDTGEHLSGNAGNCTMTRIYNDNTMAHDCDTTRGDSGSPFMIQDGEEYFIVATDSNFRSNPGGPMIYIAARSDRWADLVDDFAAGRIGNDGPRPRGPGKPPK